jgi:phosphoglycolate phosphatase-like HAD superfamily hydrolase
MNRPARIVLTALIAILALGFEAFGQNDPLPSWNETPTKKAILDFVTRVAAQGPDFVPEADRIAVFDMDGTLIPERPVPAALIPLLADLKQQVADKPFLGEKPAVAALLKGDEAVLQAAGEQGINDVIAVATDGKTTDEVAANVRPLMEETPHPKFGVPYSRAVYAPMRELLAYLDANGFKNFICSGSPVIFTRELSQDMFGIPPERVMGTNALTEYDMRHGKTVLVFEGRAGHINDREGKPPTINLAVGARPVFVAGNEGGRGDIAMMRWSKDRDGPSFQLLIDHDDAAREYAYAEPDNYSLNAAARYRFQVVSIAKDWRAIIGN